MSTIKFRNKQYQVNPDATDLHVGYLAGAINLDDNSIDGFCQMAKQLCFIFPGCDFATYDPVTRDGSISLKLAELIELLSILKDFVNTDAEALDDVVEVTDQMHQLQTLLAGLSTKYGVVN